MVVEDLLRFGVTGQKDLKSAIQLEPIHPIGANPASNAVRLLQNQILNALPLETPGTAQASQTRTDNDHVMCHPYLSSGCANDRSAYSAARSLAGCISIRRRA
jgi:hypothetical protein